jgi:hypothetical protein
MPHLAPHRLMRGLISARVSKIDERRCRRPLFFSISSQASEIALGGAAQLFIARRPTSPEWMPAFFS